jgi:16S rRNA (cytosine1402-N4)-methyltransferase
MKTPQQLHIPVLLDATLRCLAPQVGESYLDLTAGYGGHARAVIDQTKASDRAVLVDRDENSIRELKNQCGFAKTEFVHDDFLAAAKGLQARGSKFDLVLMDLGVSSPQLDEPVRGFSFQKSAPLDMRMDARQQLTAAEVVNHMSEKQLSEVLLRFGEQKPKTAIKLARAIRLNRPISSTVELADIVARTSPQGRAKIHPATRTFQAIRIVVNDELEQLRQTLPIAVELLRPGGRIAVISFHSLEDKIVKDYFAEQSRAGYEAKLSLITKKPIRPDQNELVYNPRARSARLRAAVKI